MQIDLLNFELEKIEQMALPNHFEGFNSNLNSLKLYLDWQGTSKMSGNHKVKTSSEVSGSTKKPFRQKGTGSARQGNSRSPILKGGGVSHGPVVRSHATSLNKKVKSLAIRNAIFYKYSLNKLKVLKDYSLTSCKTMNIAKFIRSHIASTVCFIYCNEKNDKNLVLSCRSLPGVKALSYLGINVFDVLKYDYLFFSENSLKSLIACFKI